MRYHGQTWRTWGWVFLAAVAASWLAGAWR
ncbi:MAG: hypothetical protein MOGMAGMI_02442 [Candidatus Omnitrophica bacterium]|nr:hypothetical protein [Candidatus Omnitrophota bacterium]